MSNYILLECNSSGAAQLILNRPEKHNAFDDHLIEEFILLLEKCAADPAIRVLVIKANGKNFSAGADLSWMQRMVHASPQENRQDAVRLAYLLEQLNHFPKPTLAVIQGKTFGGGIGLIACCDIAIASSEASFCFSEIKMGLAPAVISPYVFAAMPARACRRYFLTAESFDADTALQWGLIHQITGSNELEKIAQQTVDVLLRYSDSALKANKQLIFDVLNARSREDCTQKTTALIAKLRTSQEAQVKLTEFLTKKGT